MLSETSIQCTQLSVPNDGQISDCTTTSVTPGSYTPWSYTSDSTMRRTPKDIPHFRHEPLRNPRNHIRLLHVMIDNARAIEGIKLHCRLVTRYFNPWKRSPFSFLTNERKNPRPMYHAISYVWGSTNDTVSILVNGRRMEVGRNCEYALKQSAWHGGARYIWCDAICIDQKNDDEKGHQVYMMGAIYLNAQTVLACVGPHADGSPVLLRALRRQADVLDSISSLAPDDRYSESSRRQPFSALLPSRRPPKWLKLAREWASHEDEDMFELILAMKGFLGREYFSRMWIYQEVVLGRHIILCCGRTTARLYSLYGMFLAMEYLEHLKLTDTERAWPLLRAGAFSRSTKEKEDLGTLLRDVLPLKCSDPRDKVYAVLSLLSWRDKYPLYPDYTITTLSLACKVLADERWQERHDRLDVTWEKLPIISDNLRLSNPASGLARALYTRRFSPQLVNRTNWPYLRLGGEQRRVRHSVRFTGFQLDRKRDTWRLRDASLGRKSLVIHQCQFDDRENLENEMIRTGTFEADFAILLPEVASPGDWCLLPYCHTTEQPSSLILIVRREKGSSDHQIVGKGIGWREDALWRFSTIRHNFWVRFGSEDLLVLFNQGVFSFCDFIERPASGGVRLLFEEMKDYMRTGVCGRPRSSIAWSW